MSLHPKYPSDLTANEKIASMIRVNHAGEYGAARIYEGQLAILGNKECADTIRHMREQEQEHLDLFDKQIVARKVRPTVLSPVWHLAGYALGMGTALLGEKAAMACTVAVEEVIDEHYAEQERDLENIEEEQDLRKMITKCRQDELEHRDIGLHHGAEETPGYPILAAAIKGASKMAIWLSKRF